MKLVQNLAILNAFGQFAYIFQLLDITKMRQHYALYEAVLDGFATLGEPVAHQLMSQLYAEGLTFAAGDIDPKVLSDKLKKLFGSGSNDLMRVIYEKFVDKLEVTQRVAMPEEMEASEKIVTILATFPNG